MSSTGENVVATVSSNFTKSKIYDTFWKFLQMKITKLWNDLRYCIMKRAKGFLPHSISCQCNSPVTSDIKNEALQMNVALRRDLKNLC